MFPLNNRTPLTYRFRTKTWYSSAHLGVDYRARYEELKAPFKGEVIKSFYGVQGSRTIWFKPDHDSVVMRFMHLDRVVKTGRVNEGEVIAITGNTGMSTAAHLHIDITNNWSGSFWTNINNFRDPETYGWDHKPVQAKPEYPKTVTVTVDSLRVRTAPSLKSAIVPQPTHNKRLNTGDKFTAVSVVTGDYVAGDNRWYKSSRGNYVSAKYCK